MGMCILHVGSSLCTVSVGHIQNKLQVNTCEISFCIAHEAANLMHADLIDVDFTGMLDIQGNSLK